MQLNQPDYSSRVPHRHYPETWEEQKEMLRQDPQIVRFAASREAYRKDPHRPFYHFVSPENTLNDPNGLCFWQGMWHLFYQGYPPEDPRQHWGHAVSEDLVHWNDLPYAIYPGPEECCFSGATYVEEDRVIAMYHGTRRGNMVAVSRDPLLLNWEKLAGDAVIPNLDGSQVPPPYSVFDPCIWKSGDFYYSLSGGSLPHPASGRHVRAEFVFRSPDLTHWEYLHPFLEEDRFGLLGDDGACPYFWPIGDRHILLHFSHMSGGKYLIGRYDPETVLFHAQQGGSFNSASWGPGGVHAPSAAPDGEGGVIAIFNINVGRTNVAGWDQIMSLPRRFTLGGFRNDQLMVSPAGDIASLRKDHQHIGPMELPANQEVVLEKIQGSAMELYAEFAPDAQSVLELNVLRSPGREEYTRITFYRERGMVNWDAGAALGKPFWRDSLLCVDSTYSSRLPDVLCRAPEIASLSVAPDEPLQLRVFVDKSIVEVFANGKQCISLRVYPGRTDSTGVSVRSQGGAGRLLSLDSWQMERIY